MNNTNTLCKPSLNSKKGKLVSTQHVDQLISNYKKERWIHNSEKLGKPDSLSTWYGLSELQSFMDLAKKNQADGIKMYYGVYPAELSENPELQGRQTVVLVATKHKKTANGSINKEINIARDGRPEILAFNYGTVCPPFCTPPDFPDGFPELEMSGIGISLIEKDNHVIVV